MTFIHYGQLISCAAATTLAAYDCSACVARGTLSTSV